MERSFGELVHGREVVYDLNDKEKRFISMLMTNKRLPGAAAYDSQMAMNTSTENIDISLASEFQKHLSYPAHTNVVIDHGKDRK